MFRRERNTLFCSEQMEIACILMNRKISKVDHVMRQSQTKYSIEQNNRVNLILATVKNRESSMKFTHTETERATNFMASNKTELANQRASTRLRHAP